MAYDFQVTIDCAAPHELADWWAETLGWTVEPTTRGVHPPDDRPRGRPTEEDTTTHSGVLVWREGAADPPPPPPHRARRGRSSSACRRRRR